MTPILPCSVLLLTLLLAPPALAATFRYSTSSDRLYVENGGTATLTQIKAALPKAPLDLVDAGARVWLLRTNLYVEDGTTLLLHGVAVGGDVNELRLKSDSSGFVQLAADQGSIDIRSTNVRSWNAAADAPDTNLADGRAFVRVRSRLASDGVTPLESRMDVIDSEISYLGYNASEAQGLVWKVLGSTSTAPDLFDRVQVRGDIRDSYIHHNYYGVYTYGHQGGQWVNNEVAYNVGYGIDPHDDSDELLIQDNYVHDNGNHGIIASKRCNNIVIRGNRSWDNVGNGIMLHRSSDDGLVEFNDLRRNTDSGIAIFASLRSTIRDNLLLDNFKAGMRFSNGAADSFVENNEVLGSGTYGFYFYQGSDTPEPGDDGRNKRNVFHANLVRDGQFEAIKMTDSDDSLFIDNTFDNNNTSLRFVRSRTTQMIGNTLPADVKWRLSGTSAVLSNLYIEAQPLVPLALDAFSSATLADSAHAVFDVSENVASIGDVTRSSMQLASAQIGADTLVYTRDMRAVPSAGQVEITVTLWTSSGTRTRNWSARLDNSAASVSYSVGSLLPGSSYRVTQGGTLIGVFSADAGGRINFVHAPGSTLSLGYSLTQA